MPRFTVRSMLALTALAAVALLSLVKPSFVWLVLWPFIVSGLCIFVFIRVTTIRQGMVFWGGFAVGIISFISVLGSVDLLAALTTNGPTEEFDAISRWLWNLVHPGSMVTSNLRRPVEYASFTVSFYVLIAICWSAITTLLAQFLFRERGKQ